MRNGNLIGVGACPGFPRGTPLSSIFSPLNAAVVRVINLFWVFSIAVLPFARVELFFVLLVAYGRGRRNGRLHNGSRWRVLSIGLEHVQVANDVLAFDLDVK